MRERRVNVARRAAAVAVPALLLASCVKSPGPAAPAPECESPAAGEPMTEAMCSCRGGNVQLAIGRAVELHCEPDEVELGPIRIDERDGWCCRPR
jgi:hypothetical protein